MSVKIQGKLWPRGAVWLALAFLTGTLVSAAHVSYGSQLLDMLWSPNGARVALVMSVWSVHGSATEIRVVKPGGESWTHTFHCDSMRLVGWTPDGALAIDEDDGALTLVYPYSDHTVRFPIPGGALPIATDGHVVYYLSPGGRRLLAGDREGKAQVVAHLPEGTRPSGCLSPDGDRLALRRTVRTQAGWSTQIWVLHGASYRHVVTLPGSYVRLCWHPNKPEFVANMPQADNRWSARLVNLKQGEQMDYDDLPSPVQWDRQGRLYVADQFGLWQLSGRVHRLRSWTGLPELWAVSPLGDLVATSVDDGAGTPVAFLPLR